MKHIKTKIIRAKSIMQIDFSMFQKNAVECLLFDIEGTLTQWGGDTVPEEIRHRIADAGIKKIGIVSNMPSQHKARADSVGMQIGAGIVMVPLNASMRKPRATMVEECLRQLNVTAEQTVLIGDKYIDVLTAQNAGLREMIWVDVMPGDDHWFDRYVYRRVEPLIKRLIIKSH